MKLEIFVVLIEENYGLNTTEANILKATLSFKKTSSTTSLILSVEFYINQC